ncbi:MAG: tRNA preQ1(34) S-adenosylmethionine ribosyltransferase-isomerase QueA [Candidatus Melainabacteria bacterium GWF2_32_7]|nr:MAG: tRNA preQ1(34) S-adenosylmethionine ribosyltransferase-isomerase QueA [Candidatus Melainabacteria bacterium GWF2_32_7]
MHISEFDYNLPKELIAQFPSEKRDYSNLMVLDRSSKTIEHKKFFSIADYLSENDVLVMNNTRVIPARLIGKKSTGANIEIFLLEKKTENIWEVLIKPAKRVKSGTIVEFSEELSAEIINKSDNDKWVVELKYNGDLNEILNKVGNIPLPPYIMRTLSDSEIKKLDYQRYQTVYAQTPGSVAAPTAGLHFTEDLLGQIRQKGVQICYVTLNVGLGTFKPVRAEDIRDHKMDKETYEISKETANIISNAKKEGKNIVAVGTTTVRTLETVYKLHSKIIQASGSSDIFIYPGYKFNVVDKLITNFHLPKSTLLMLVSAFADKQYMYEAYKEAIEKKYRFYSYGDCMFIL